MAGRPHWPGRCPSRDRRPSRRRRLLDDLLGRLDQVPGATDLLIGVSVYREPVDVNAVLFQAGQPDPDAEHLPDRKAATQQIIDILGAAGVVVDDAFDPASVPADIRAKLAPHIAELNRSPTPPFRPPPGLRDQVMASQAASLLTLSGEDGDIRFFVHRWTATELAARAPGDEAHQQAAAYWQWRVKVWPQARASDVHDMLEARHHLLQAGDAESAGEVTEMICSQLHTWGAWDQEAALIYDTLDRLPADSPRQAPWMHQLGIIAQERGDYDEAARQYQRSLDITERLGDEASLARGYHQLGRLAQERGDYDEATRQYQRTLDISEQLDDQEAIASSYHNLGAIAHQRGDHEEATRQYQRSMDISERLGDEASLARAYHQLGRLAQDREAYDEAARQYQRSVDIKDRLGDQSGLAISYHQLGIIAQERGRL